MKGSFMKFTIEDAVEIGEEIGIDWDRVEFSPEDFLVGLEIELEHGTERGEEVNVTDDDPLATGMIAWAHLMETPLYYSEEVGLPAMEKSLEEGEEVVEASSKRYAYVLDEIVEKHPDYISPEVGQMAKKFIQQAEKNAQQHAEMFDDEEEAIEYLSEALERGPNLGSIASGDLVELLVENPVMGAIPLSDLKADNLIRGDKIDVYDYLEASLKHLIERVSLAWLRGETKQRKKEEEKRLEQEKAKQRDEEGTVVLRKQPQQMGASAKRFATIRFNGKDY